MGDQDRDVDCSNAARGVWLVKVPKYIASRWSKAPPMSEAGRLRITKQTILKASQPVRQVKQLDRIVQNYKPVADHKHNLEFEQKKKAEGKKAREDKEKVLDMLFSAFEKHQYYNIKDLEKITRQPVPYLKEILKEICNYNAKNPHKNMWELKPEYRHYKDQEAKQ
ncbi:hypothetical protein HPB52_012980 [Rhipicephalus sanguineus]|uniref:General transcription factor IIF subunit 2 n=1 Tax=Rhipicephalus sanguineus TaxID=34632 RepID=A0A9D4T0P4_RHISA|nr:hypothetical protein HPB52_012980 [Rhipicephalus sanguineus]